MHLFSLPDTRSGGALQSSRTPPWGISVDRVAVLRCCRRFANSHTAAIPIEERIAVNRPKTQNSDPYREPPGFGPASHVWGPSTQTFGRHTPPERRGAAKHCRCCLPDGIGRAQNWIWNPLTENMFRLGAHQHRPRPPSGARRPEDFPRCRDSHRLRHKSTAHLREEKP